MVRQTTMWILTLGTCQQGGRDHCGADRCSQDKRLTLMWQRLLLYLGTVGLWLSGCSSDLMPHIVTHPMALSAPDGWHDGVYTGTSDRVGDPPTPQLVRVTMDVSRGRIVTVRVHQPPGWKAPQEEALLLRQVLEQSPAGQKPPAPGSSEADQLLRALDDAITKARISSPTTP